MSNVLQPADAGNGPDPRKALDGATMELVTCPACNRRVETRDGRYPAHVGADPGQWCRTAGHTRQTLAAAVTAADDGPDDDAAERELVDRYTGLLTKGDDFLINLVADPPRLMRDADETAAAAAVILKWRLGGRLAPVA